MRAEVDVRLLGRFAVRRLGREIVPAAFGGRLARTLVRVLLVRRGRFIGKDELTEALWPRRLPANPGASLEVLISRARKALADPSLILTGQGAYAFTGDERIVVDSEVFASLVRGAHQQLAAGRAIGALRDLRRALELWDGEPLPDDVFSDWAQEFRRELARIHVEALEAAGAAAVAVGDPREAVRHAERAVARESLRESAHLLLVHALAASGDRAGALASFDSFRERLADDLGLDPSAEAGDLQRRILRGDPLPPPRVGTAEGIRVLREEFLPFVGREREVELVLRAVTAGGAVLVSGVAGTGKSRLLQEAAARAALPVLAVAAFMPERDEPWALARGLLLAALDLEPGAVRAVPERAAGALADLVPELEAPPEGLERTPDPESRRALVLQGGLRLVTAALRDGGAVLVDDVQWADATSLALLHRIVHRADRVGVAFTVRPEDLLPGSPFASFVSDLRATGGIADVPLGSLAREAVAEILDDANLVEAIVDRTDATPHTVSQVVGALARERAIERDHLGRWRPRSPISPEVAREGAKTGQRLATTMRADRLPPHSREILDLLALVGRQVPARVPALAARQDERAVLEVLDGLSRAGLVRLGEEGWATAHDLIGESLTADLSRERAAALHAALAEALGQDGADPGEVARHLAEAGDGRGAAAGFADAAERALVRFANDEASRLAEEGLALEAAPDVRLRLLDARAEARARAGDLAGARADLRAVQAETSAGAGRARVLARLAFLASGAEDLARAAELVDLAIAEAAGDPRARAEALTVAAIVEMNRGAADRARLMAGEALELFERVGDARGMARILDVVAMATFLDGRIGEAVALFDRAARLFLEVGDLLRAYTPRSARGHGLLYMARPVEALAEVEEALDLVRSVGHPEGEAFCLWHRSQVFASLGRAGDAVEDAKRGLAIAEHLGHREWTAACLRGLGIALEAAADLEAAEAAFRRSLTAAEGLPHFASWAAARIALLLVAGGREDEAEPYVDRALAEGTGLSRFEARLARAELSAARGDDDARRMAEEALHVAEAEGHLVSAQRLRVLAGAA